VYLLWVSIITQDVFCVSDKVEGAQLHVSISWALLALFDLPKSVNGLA